MSKLLLDDEPLVILPKLAAAIGLNEAIILQQLHYWLEKSKNVRDGFRWVYNTYEEWQKQFPFWSESTIKRTIKKLEGQHLIIVGKYNKLKIDNTKWYRIDYEVLQNIENNTTGQNDQTCNQNDQTTGQSEQTNRAKWSGGRGNVDRPLPEITTETTTDKNDDVDKHPLTDEEFQKSYNYLLRNNIPLSETAMQDLGEFSDVLGSQIIMEAVDRAVDQNAKRWKYISGILFNWQKSNVKTMADVIKLDEDYKNQRGGVGNATRRGRTGKGYGTGRSYEEETASRERNMPGFIKRV
ncbi:DnaD domain protein [Bacillus albus]|uniref:DnaD domain-containing protein n=1 Tax=Bacillus cereus group TaxID=86661 RepID=UPI0022E933FB|nr:DnaD domain protein [Bacillus cereus group sp. Bc177]MDA2320258.1 DnaD domain protein [Bacillus cereus group sp. Bc177]